MEKIEDEQKKEKEKPKRKISYPVKNNNRGWVSYKKNKVGFILVSILVHIILMGLLLIGFSATREINNELSPENKINLNKMILKAILFTLLLEALGYLILNLIGVI